MNTHKGSAGYADGTGHAEQLAAFAARLKGETVPEGKRRSRAAAGGSRAAAGGRAPRDGEAGLNLDTYANRVDNAPQPPSDRAPQGPEKKVKKKAKKKAKKKSRRVPVTPEEKAEARNVRRMQAAQLRGFVRENSKIPRVRKCGVTVRRAAGVGVAVTYDGGHESDRLAGFRGLYSCGSAWACPRCGEAIAMERAEEVQKAIEGWKKKGGNLPTYSLLKVQRETDEGVVEFEDRKTGEWFDSALEGTPRVVDRRTGEVLEVWKGRKVTVEHEKMHEAGQVVFATFTFRHQPSEERGKSKFDLDPMWRGLGGAWKSLQVNSRAVKDLPGYIRVAEHTHSEAFGWHVHLHVLMFVSNEFAEDLEANSEKIKAAWIEAVEANGYEAAAAGQDLRLVRDAEADAGRIAGYMTKEGQSRWSAAAEVTGAAIKEAASGSVTPFQMLKAMNTLNALGLGEGELAEFGDGAVEDITGVPYRSLKRLDALYHEYESASHGKRQMTWSRGLKKAFGIVEVTDQQVADVNDSDDGGSDDKAPKLDQLTPEIGGFPHAAGWNKIATDAANGVARLRRYLERAPEEKAGAWLKAWSYGFGVDDVIVGDEWQERLEKFREAEEEYREENKPAAAAARRRWKSDYQRQLDTAEVMSAWSEGDPEPSPLYPQGVYPFKPAA